ncbi:MAG: SUMF1/EgtB/PvdO family nonheme iron enzyme [Planctomycetes bacterium]|nr:SUMF1/EgtB/PvdO family nonheme iron enzyme [Planctomycetota bacterium]
MSAPPTPLPLPVARLRRRSHNAKSPKDRHDTAYFAWEVSLRLGVAAAPPAEPGSLARASVGQWAGALRVHERPITDERVLALFARLTEVGTDKRSERRSIAPRELVHALPAYRNRVIGHSSARAASFYEEAGAELLEALDAAWDAELFLPRDARLLFAESIQLGSDGAPRARLLALDGDAPTVVDPRGTVVPRELLPHRLYLRREERWTPLHPWLLFDEESERVLCFNGLARRAEYLDYASGETLAGPELEKRFPGVTDELRRMFGASSGGGDAPPASGATIEDARFFGDYEVLGKLGQGGMGAVYLARQKSLERLVALKMLPAERAHDAIAVARFKREIDALSRCEHANVIKILACGEARGTHYYAMEYVEGADLARVARALSSSSSDFDTAVSSACEAVRGERKELFADVPLIERKSRAPAQGNDRYRQAARLFADAAHGLAHLHTNGILHRDISPANIMVTWPDERAVVMDLGLAGVDNASVTLTKDDRQILGTLRYIAPEQLQRSLLAVDKRADIYSIGATLYELLADRPMWDGETEAQLIQQVIREEPPPLEKIAPKVPRDLALIVAKACEKDPKLRYETADALADDLERFLAGEPVTARPPTIGYLIGKWVTKHKELATASVVAVLALAGVIAWAIVSLSERNARLAQRNREVLELSVMPELADLEKEAQTLWPIGDPHVLERCEKWLERAQQIRDGSEERPSFAELSSQLAQLRNRGKALSVEEKSARRQVDERYVALDLKRRQLELALRLLARRNPASQSIAASADDPPPDWPRLPADWEGLNRRAWQMVGWIEYKVGTDDGLALQITRRALELVQAADSKAPETPHACEVRDTLAWALFRNGLDEEAVLESERALRESSGEQRFKIEDSRTRLADEILAAKTPATRDALVDRIAALRTQIQAAEEELAWSTDWRFEDQETQKRHDTLTVLLLRMERFFDRDTGLFEGRKHAGELAVKARSEWTKLLLRQRDEPAITMRWDDARRALQADKATYGGLDLQPQLGMLPIGRNHDTGSWEFFMPLLPDSTIPRLPESTERPCDDGLILVVVPGGKFIMGVQRRDPASPNYEPPSEEPGAPPLEDEFSSSGDPIEVDIEPFFLSKFEATQAQWKRLMNSNPSLIRDGEKIAGVQMTPQQPVNNLTWEQAARTLVRFGLVLPTEAQWERAALAGESWDPLSIDRIDEYANTADRSMTHDEKLMTLESIDRTIDDGWAVLSPVGSLKPNAWGFYDMQGNVWEWCKDAYGSYDEPVAPGTAERLPYSKTHRVLRGGGAFESPSEARIPRRNYDAPNYSSLSTGVRPARLIQRAQAPKAK